MRATCLSWCPEAHCCGLWNSHRTLLAPLAVSQGPIRVVQAADQRAGRRRSCDMHAQGVGAGVTIPARVGVARSAAAAVPSPRRGFATSRARLRIDPCWIASRSVVARAESDGTRSDGQARMDDLIASEEEFRTKVMGEELCLVDWMATWCRKCKYIKPKLVKLMETEYPNIPLFFVDVNSVPYDLVKDYRIAKMPTVTILRKGEIARTYLCSEDAVAAVNSVRRMIELER